MAIENYIHGWEFTGNIYQRDNELKIDGRFDIIDPSLEKGYSLLNGNICVNDKVSAIDGIIIDSKRSKIFDGIERPSYYSTFSSLYNESLNGGLITDKPTIYAIFSSLDSRECKKMFYLEKQGKDIVGKYRGKYSPNQAVTQELDEERLLNMMKYIGHLLGDEEFDEMKIDVSKVRDIKIDVD